MDFVSISSFLNYIFPLNTFILNNFAEQRTKYVYKNKIISYVYSSAIRSIGSNGSRTIQQSRH